MTEHNKHYRTLNEIRPLVTMVVVERLRIDQKRLGKLDAACEAAESQQTRKSSDLRAIRRLREYSRYHNSMKEPSTRGGFLHAVRMSPCPAFCLSLNQPPCLTFIVMPSIALPFDDENAASNTLPLATYTLLVQRYRTGKIHRLRFGLLLKNFTFLALCGILDLFGNSKYSYLFFQKLIYWVK